MKYKVSDTDLQTVANAIRTKGGTSAALEFPDGFATAIGNIPTGGSSTLITKSITANGTYNASSDNADGYSSVTVAVPLKVIEGTFTGSTTGAAMTVNIPYTGNGYPLVCVISPSDGAWKASGSIRDVVQKSVIISAALIKDDFSSTPTFTSQDAAENKMTYIVEYKSSDSDASATSGSVGKNAGIFTTVAAAGNSAANCSRFSSKTTLSVFIAGTSYGYKSGVEYKYRVIYSE